LPAALAAIALVATGCGSISATAETPATTITTTVPVEASGFPVTVETANGSVTVDARPERIVSLSPTSTEVLFAIGAGSQVVAVDDQSNYPAEAPVADLTGFDPNLEAIAGYGADLVILMYDPGEAVAGLEALGIPVILHPAAWTLDDAYAQITQVGAATGHADEAAELVDSMAAQIAAVTETTGAARATYYHELSPDYYTATSATFIGSLYALVGLESIADDADPDGYGYPQLSAEHILATDPTFIFLADTLCCAQTTDTVGERPGWSALTAVQAGAVIELDDDVASRWGPRVVELVETIAAAVEARTSG
jgi:iron complex transport system substrate-binding protein